ncbi:MAG: C25 family cysteine peptidase [Candidatus Acidiferrales bacterium]
MTPTLEGGELLTVEPVGERFLAAGDIIFTHSDEGLRAHRIVALPRAGSTLETKGDAGWHPEPVALDGVLGRVTQSERDGQIMKHDTRAAHWRAAIRAFTKRARTAVVVQLRRAGPVAVFALALCTYFALSASPVAAQTDLSLTSAASPSTVTPSGDITYTQVVTNNGPNAATTAVLYQQTPANTTFVSIAAPTGWTCATPGAGNAGAVTCTDGANLNSNATASFTYVVAVNSGTAAGSTIYDWTNVTSQTADSLPSNNSTTNGTLVETAGGADLGVTVTASPTPVFVASPLAYTIVVTNYGPAATTASTLTDALPTGFTFGSVAATPSSVSCSGTTTVTCALGAIAVGGAATVTITGTSSGTSASLTNSPALSATAPADPYSDNDSATVITVVQPLVCATPGNDGAAPTFNGIVNAYYPPSATGTLAAGATQIKLGRVAAGGATTVITKGDLLLVIQMQAATINTANTGSYGDGVSGDPAYGSTALNGVGDYEFVTAASTLKTNAGGTLTITGAGVGGGLLYSYFNNVATSTQGAQTYQVVRVPQYTSATLNSNLEALAWSGAVGGILAIDVQNQLTLGGTVALDSDGFRGGGGRILTGDTGLASTDYWSLSTKNANGTKGEGIAGTPAYIAPLTFTTSTTATATGQTYVEGIPAGASARGAPGNAGGGSTDGNPSSNNQNSGGGAGGNGGLGGNGGFAWQSAGLGGGFGGYLFPATTSSLVMGGAGGAGTTNDGSWYNPATNTGGADCGTTCTGIYSSGAPGGGIAIFRAGYVTGTGTITSNGGTALDPENDGAGGAGAGGSIVLFSNSGGLSGLTVAANGGNGGNTWETEAPGAFPGNRHGPGGGGGGGVIFLSSAPLSASVSGGVNGYSTTANDSYGATPGTSGFVSQNYTITQVPGVQSGAYCSSADLSVSNVGTPNPVSPGGTITYTQIVTNNSTTDAVNAVFSENISQNTTFTSISVPTGWSCTTPAVGSSGLITCTDPDVAGSSTGTFKVVTGIPTAAASGTQILNTASIASGTNDPNLGNNTASVLTLVAASTSADVVVTKTANLSQVTPGATSTITYTVVVKNNGPAAAATNILTDATPANTTFASLAQTGTAWTCTKPTAGSAGTVSCTLASLAVGGTTTFTIVVNVPAGPTSGTITNSANVSSTTVDPNPNNNTGSASTTIIQSTQNNLSVTNAASPYPVYAGKDVTFAQVVTNAGPAAGTTVTLSGSIPTGSTFVSLAKPTGWTCTTPAVGGTGAYSCKIGTLASGGTGTFTLVVLVPTGTVGGTQISNTASVAETPNNDIATANNSATASTVVFGLSQADVAIVKTGAPTLVDQGTNLTYTLQVTNNGPSAAQNVIVSDPLPTGAVTFVSVSTTQGTCTQSGGVVSCSLGTVTNGGLAFITINTTASTFPTSSIIANTATVSASTADPNLTNNISSTITTIVSPTAVNITGFRAVAQPAGGVVLEWRTKSELRNLGFHIYREDATGRHQINPSLIAGAALFARGGMPQHSAKTYRWIDPQGTAQSVYTLEDVDLSGGRTAHGPVVAESSTEPLADQPQALLLSQFNRRYGTAVPSRLLPHIVNSAPAAPSTPQVASGTLDTMPAAKISVQAEGWYSVTASQLAAAGFNISGNSQLLQLYAEGIEQPILILGNASGALGPNGAIEFYGTPIDTPFSGTRVYWLVSGSTPGKRITAASAASSASSAPSSFLSTVVLQQRTTYFAALLNGENYDNFFGASVTTDPVDQVLAAPNADPSSNLQSSIDVTLQGVTAGAPHAVTVFFNGSTLGTMEFDGQANVTNTFQVQNSLLQEGNNTVTLTAQDGENDVSLVQSIALRYPHIYAADSNWLEATAPANSQVSIAGFTNPNVQVFDITDPLNITALTGTVQQFNSAFAVAITTPAGTAGNPRTLLALSADQIAQPSALAYHMPTASFSTREGFEEIIVTTSDFRSTLQPLLDLRTSQSRTTQVVLMDQLYDAYNYGERTPYALREYLSHAYETWRVRPQDVLLVGTASVDPRNYLGFGYFDFVPTRLIETAAFKTASDDWLTDFNQTGFATMPTGRLPVRTAAEATLVISKIVDYERGSSSGSWNSQALFVADQNVGSNFTDAASSAVSLMPPSVITTKILADTLDQATAQQQVLAALNSGSVLVDYSGHGSEQQWSFEDLFDNTAAAGLTNGSRLPVYVLMDCLNGFFHDVYDESLSTALMLAPNGGAVAVWASSGFTTEPPQAVMNQAFLRAVASKPSLPLGRAAMQAKKGIADADVRRTWILFGDPSMSIAFPQSTVPSN